MTSPPSWRQSPYASPPHWELQTEHRLTKAEGRLEHHQEKHDRQTTWNRGFMAALISLGSAVAHTKADNVADALVWLASHLLK